MLISSEKDHQNISSPMGSDPGSLNGLPPHSSLLESPPLSMDFTDVNVIPECEKNALEQTIANLEDEILGLKLKQKSLVEKERRTLNKILDIKGAIRVFGRIRPFLSTDGIQIRQPVSSESDKIMVKCGGSRKDFVFDKVFSQQATQEDVFIEVEPILKSALDGNNVCILAFGQTGTGKTFTMEGTNQQAGIVSRALKTLFHEASLDSTSSYTFSMSMLEVYMGNLKDLLVSKSPYKPYETVTKSNLNIQTDQKGQIEVEGLTEVQIPDFAKANWWYAKGRRVRSTSWTNVNEASSRSHCLTRINIYRRGDMKDHKTEITKLWMIDLGGSERVLRTGATGQTLDEGRAINLSISALGDVIAALRRKRGHVPYRNSKLTQILKDSLGDGSKVLMLVHVTPCEDDVAETACSLSFAKRASAIESNKELPADLKKVREKRIAALEEEIHEANEECQKIRTQIQNAELLLSENKKLFSSINDHHSPKGANDDGDAIKGSTTPPLKPEKTFRMKNVLSNSQAPRFMASTAASRQRQNAAEKVIAGRARTMPFGSTNSIHLSASQTASYSDPRFKSILRNTNKKSRYSEETTRQSTPDVTLSNPNLRVPLNRHRRRMSDFQ